MYEIRDPIHGFIKISEWEKDILDHSSFQRLRRIRQLAWTDMVYPGATHTRFEHSMGVMHVASEMYKSILSRKKEYLIDKLGFNDAGLDHDLTLLRLTSLVHDIGHPPFSHAGEGLMPKHPETNKPYKHEDYSAAIVKYVLKDKIENHRENENYHITAQNIIDLLKGNPQLGRRLLWHNIINGQIDADRSDYLLRDSYHIGVSYGNYDLKRLIISLTVTEFPETGTSVIAVEEGGLHAAESLIIARYMMFTQVYYHHTRRSYDYHITEAMKQILSEETGRECFPEPTSKENIEQYLKWDDWRVLGLLSQGKGGEHGEALRTRCHHRSVYHTREVPLESEIEESKKILEKLGNLAEFVDDAKRSWYSFDGEDIMIARDNKPHKGVPLSTLSSVVKCLSPVRQRRIYVSLSNKHEAKQAIEKYRREA